MTSKVLIGCEESGTITNAMRQRGIEAYSCDLQPTRGNPDWHIQGDVVDAVKSSRWDLIILHPDCTAMSLAGNSTYGVGCPKHNTRLNQVWWTLRLWDTSKLFSHRVALENPASVIFPPLRNNGARVQFIQPYEYGHTEQKKTGFALHNLPDLLPTDNVYDRMMELPRNERERVHFMPPGPNRKRDRSKTYQGIADAIADQWGSLLCQH